MANTSQNEYLRISVTPPGWTLVDTLEYIGMPRTELAERIGYPVKTINEIIQGKGASTSDIAFQLEQVLDIDASFWLKGEQHYRTFLARQAQDPRLRSWVKWLKRFPMQEMIRRGWVPSCESETQQVFEMLRFFEVVSPTSWGVTKDEQIARYRKSSLIKKNTGALTVWLRQGQIKAWDVETRSYNAETFGKVLKEIRSLTVEPVSCLREELVRLCAKAGVVVVFVEELLDLEICAATHWCFPAKAIIQLSPRYETDDQLLFTFFHSAGHLLLHKKHQTFLEIEQEERDEAEEQADRFAANLLIDTIQWQEFIKPGAYRTEKGVREFAQKLEIAPSIVVRRLQEEKLLPLDHFNHLKRHLEWQPEQQRHVSFG